MAFKLSCVSSLWSFLYNPQDFCSDQMRIKLTVHRELSLFLPFLFPTPTPVAFSHCLHPFCRQGQPVYPITTGGFRHPYPTALTVNASMSRWVQEPGSFSQSLWCLLRKFSWLGLGLRPPAWLLLDAVLMVSDDVILYCPLGKQSPSFQGRWMWKVKCQISESANWAVFLLLLIHFFF